ncbi:MAG: IclR family transcriptional regulator [Tetrasphaera sp.]|nr:IclR family transcriptional regulator [Tetrasphaera sp.]
MVERMTLILDEFVGPSARLTLEDVARRTHLPRSTAHRILDQLVRLQWLDHTSFGYSLGARSLGLGGRDNGHCEVRSAAAPHLHDLLMRTGLTVHLAVLDGAEVYILDKIGGRDAAQVPTRVGGRLPAASTALGRSMLAWLAPEDVDDLLAHVPATQELGAHSRPEHFHAELNRIRMRQGVAQDRTGSLEGMRSIAATIRGPEGPAAAIALVGPAEAPLERVGPLVLDAARKISQELFPGVRRTRTRTLAPVD